eukprot:4500351-Pyramimonas_sp.AAC.1
MECCCFDSPLRCSRASCSMVTPSSNASSSRGTTLRPSNGQSTARCALDSRSSSAVMALS